MPYSDPEAKREYQRRWMAERRAKYLAGLVCVDCGSSDRPELDHRDPAQKVSHRIWSWRHDRILHEMAKCDVRCADCHHARHGAERERHGVSRYDAGCRCDICRAARSAKGARLRREAKAARDAAATHERIEA